MSTLSSTTSRKVLVICGPTATGKTALGIRLAKTFSGEIISADSRQVYKGIDALTGQGNETRVWLQGTVDPEDDFSIAKWRELFWEAAEKLWNENKLPVVVGLTGFYLHALTNEMETIDIPPNEKLREELEGKNVDELSEILKTKDLRKFNSLNSSDQQNPRRLIRAIEVADQPTPASNYKSADLLFIGLNAPVEILDKRIDTNVDGRVENAIKETKELLNRNISNAKPALQTHGFRNLAPFVKGEISLESAVAKWKTGEHQDARKQFNRLKKEKRIKWFNITDHNYIDEVENMVKNWYYTSCLRP